MLWRNRRILQEQKRPLGRLWLVVLVPTLALFIAGLVLVGLHTYTQDESFLQFTLQQGKKYASNEEFAYRQTVFLRNKAKIDAFNQGNSGVFLKINQFADWTEEEMQRPKIPYQVNTATYESHFEEFGNISKALDWSELGMVTEVKNERDCITSWIFAPIAAAESLYAIQNREEHLMLEFSEQAVMDCCGVNLIPCHEGHPQDTFTCSSRIGFALEAEYPYEGLPYACREHDSVFNIEGYSSLPTGNHTAIIETLQVKPVVVMVDASSPEFLLYSSGIYNLPCSPSHLTHAMLLVGYNYTDPENSYYKLKNSWGTAWGEAGYMRLAMNMTDGPGTCGVQVAVIAPLEVD